MEMDIQTGIIVGQKLIRFLSKDDTYYLDFDGQIKPKASISQMIIGMPWIFHETSGRMKCPLWQTLHFGCFSTVSQYCVEQCWKLVIRPYKVKHLFEIHDYLKDKLQFQSKAGLDMRTYSFGLYRAFMYFREKKPAKTYEHKLKSMFPKEHYDIYVKRGCTEFENRAPSSEWKVGETQPAFEKFLTEAVHQGELSDPAFKLTKFKQPEWLLHTIRLYWAQSAYAAGDSTWQETPYAPYVQVSRKPVKY